MRSSFHLFFSILHSTLALCLSLSLFLSWMTSFSTISLLLVLIFFFSFPSLSTMGPCCNILLLLLFFLLFFHASRIFQCKGKQANPLLLFLSLFNPLSHISFFLFSVTLIFRSHHSALHLPRPLQEISIFLPLQISQLDSPTHYFVSTQYHQMAFLAHKAGTTFQHILWILLSTRKPFLLFLSFFLSTIITFIHLFISFSFSLIYFQNPLLYSSCLSFGFTNPIVMLCFNQHNQMESWSIRWRRHAFSPHDR